MKKFYKNKKELLQDAARSGAWYGVINDGEDMISFFKLEEGDPMVMTYSPNSEGRYRLMNGWRAVNSGAQTFNGLTVAEKIKWEFKHKKAARDYQVYIKLNTIPDNPYEMIEL